MKALILYCGTGGGHYSAAYALQEELESREHSAAMLDPYTLKGNQLDHKVNNAYIKIIQKAPKVFGFVYWLGDMYRKLPCHSPVYWANKKMLKPMQDYLEQNPADIVILTHIFPGEILTYMKTKGISIPKTVFVATDYTCIPFTEEIDCDYYVIPSALLAEDFAAKGIARERIVPLGIPVAKSFNENIDRKEAKERLGLQQKKQYILLSGGSIGAGKIRKTISSLQSYLADHSDMVLIVICGNNQDLYDKLQKRYGENKQIMLLQSTSEIAAYMKASSILISKPGGLSSTEAAVIGAPLLHISPIPGCEKKNMSFFTHGGMSIGARNKKKALIPALQKLRNRPFARDMMRKQRELINPSAASDICIFIESLAANDSAG